jgi:hypothetical protein
LAWGRMIEPSNLFLIVCDLSDDMRGIFQFFVVDNFEENL